MKELNQDFVWDYINYDILEHNKRIRDSCVYEIIKNYALDTKLFNDFTKKFLDLFIKKLSPKLGVARE